MKKRLISLSLVSVMLAGALGACAEPETNVISPKISAASSDAADYAQWLTERLENVPDEVVVGIGNSDKYDVDMDNFEDDGYIIRNVADDVVIFGKTADGLDRGVRKYANTIDLGETVEDVTYHEGYRIDELKLFGTDISEFVIVYQNEYNRNMQFAAEEMKQLILKATGCDLTITQSPAEDAHKIELRHSSDEALGDDGYKYFEENGNLVIEGAVERGCSNGVYRFLQNECGWEALIYGDSYLEEADLIDIPAGLSETETPILDYMYVHGNFWNTYVTDRTDVAWNSDIMSYGAVGHAHHGMSAHEWTGDPVNNHTGQICYSNVDKYEVALENILAYIEKEKAKTGVIPKNIDISQGDSNFYCTCPLCYEILAEDKSNSGPVLRFANQLAEDLEKAYPDEDIAVHIFAYFSTKKPPEVTTAHDNVYITFAQNGNCSNHSMYGDQCHLTDRSDSYLVTDSNYDNNEWLSKWCEIAKNVNVWYYALDTVLHQYTILDFMLDDFRYMEEKGIRGLFWQITYHGFGVKRIEQQLGVEINWNKDMSDEEYEEELCRFLEREYGDGWKFIREYIDLWIDATDRLGCFNCWGYGNNCSAEYDHVFMRDNYKYMIELVEKAIKLAGSADQEYRCKLLSCSVYYSGIYSSYFPAYEAEDDETLAELNELYTLVYDRIVELGFNPKAIVTVDQGTCEVYPTLEEEAWLIWIGEREKHIGVSASSDLRPAPEWVQALETAVTTDVPA